MQLYSSHQNDPFPCSLVSFAIDWITRHDLLAIIRARGQYFLQRLTELSQDFARVRRPRGRGLMLGFDLVSDDANDFLEVSQRFLEALLDRGCLLQTGNGGRTVRLLPNYLVTTGEIDLVVGAIRDVLTHDGF